jgi:hypothetical protein
MSTNARPAAATHREAKHMRREDNETQIVVEDLDSLDAEILPQELSLIMAYFADSLKEMFKENRL